MERPGSKSDQMDAGPSSQIRIHFFLANKMKHPKRILASTSQAGKRGVWGGTELHFFFKLELDTSTTQIASTILKKVNQYKIIRTGKLSM